MTDGRPPRRVVALGDSQTEGVGDPVDWRATGHHGWADRLVEGWRATVPDLRYRNLARAGSQMEDIRRDQLGAAVAFRPDLAFAVAGVNDVRHATDPQAVAADYHAILAGLLDAGARIVTVRLHDPVELLPLLSSNVRRAMTASLHAVRDAMDDTVRRLDAPDRLLVLDLAARPEPRDRSLYTFDRLHLNPAGHRAFAQAVADEVTRAWRLPPAVLAPAARRLGAELVHAGWIVRRWRPGGAPDALPP